MKAHPLIYRRQIVMMSSQPQRSSSSLRKLSSNVARFISLCKQLNPINAEKERSSGTKGMQTPSRSVHRIMKKVMMISLVGEIMIIKDKDSSVLISNRYLREMLSEKVATQRDRRKGRVGVWRPHLESVTED
ncbi:hypothetical protein Bca4012_062819 [Brassica carinata]